MAAAPDARGQNRYHQAVLLATSGGSANSVPPVFFPPSFVSKTQSARSQVFRLDFPKMLTLQVRAGVPRGGTTDGRVAQDNKAAGGIIPSHVREEGQLRRRRPPAGAKNKHNGLQRFFSKTDQGFKIDSKNWIVNSGRYNRFIRAEDMADKADGEIRLGALHAKLPAAEEANNLEWPDSKSVPAFGDDDSD